MSGSTWNAERLIAFEESIRQAALRGDIVSALHLSRGNENQLIEIFKGIRPTDWVFSNYRSHYHALLHDIPEAWLRREIMAGRSININSAKHRFFTSSIVGGCLPIALGLAMGIKRNEEDDKVFCFVGDMAASGEMFGNCVKYARGHKLPLTIIVEDNGMSTNTPTSEVWGEQPMFALVSPIERRYKYKRELPHSGVVQR